MHQVADVMQVPVGAVKSRLHTEPGELPSLLTNQGREGLQ